MGFKDFFENSSIDDEIEKLKKEIPSLVDIDDGNQEDQDQDDVSDLDIEDLMDLDNDGEAENEEDLNEKVKSKYDILRDRFKRKSRKLILDKLSSDKKETSSKITPATIALFHTNYIFNKSLGKFGKWVRRPNKLEFKKNNPTTKLIKNYKAKAKKMRKLLKKGNVQDKIARTSRKMKTKLGNVDVDVTGKIIRGN